MLNKHFFQQYRLEIEKKKTEMQTLKQGDSIQSKDNEAGTLGGVVTKTNNNQNTYAVNSNHLFPRENEHVYTWDLDEIGAYVFTIRDKGCEFAAIEIKECYSKTCDVPVTRDDKKKINANVYSNSLQTGNIVHKKGAKANVTNGITVSSEFYLKATDKRNRENIFIVNVIAEKFSERGDS